MLEEDLSSGEKLLLARRRTGTSIREAAASYGVTILRYRQWELDERDDAPELSIGGMDPHEHYVILRFRTGIRVGELARMMGVSESHVRCMEHGRAPLTAMIEFWGQ